MSSEGTDMISCVCNRCGQLIPAVIYSYEHLPWEYREYLLNPLDCPRCFTPFEKHSLRNYRHDPGPHAPVVNDLQAVTLVCQFALNLGNPTQLRDSAVCTLMRLLKETDPGYLLSEPQRNLAIDALRAVVQEVSAHSLEGSNRTEPWAEFLAAVDWAKSFLQELDSCLPDEAAGPSMAAGDLALATPECEQEEAGFALAWDDATPGNKAPTEEAEGAAVEELDPSVASDSELQWSEIHDPPHWADLQSGEREFWPDDWHRIAPWCTTRRLWNAGTEHDGKGSKGAAPRAPSP
ncbi:MAG: hypothetical protein ACYC63_16665 [Armatimonadota bacterium]